VKNFILITFITSLIVSNSCTKDREFAPPSAPAPICADTIAPGVLLINEFMAKGSNFFNELNPTPGDNDWVELYNNSCDTIFLNDDWFLSDDLTDSTQFSFPDTLILPGHFLTLQCDGQDVTITQIHTNFNLSSGGEEIIISYKNSTGRLIVIDEHSYGPQTPGIAMARFPDASANWITTTNPTPGAPNQQ
jgi:hypothetical protein